MPEQPEISRLIHALDDAGPSASARRVVRAILSREPVSRNVDAEHRDTRTFGERLADRIAAIGGSWAFIVAFVLALAAWIALNTVVLAARRAVFDPYPFILLNLALSTMAALQAPIIMMSQNRQATRDRLAAQHDYEVNLKAEVEIRALHDKLDALREAQWAELVHMQQEQLRLLTVLATLRAGPAAAPPPESTPERSG